MFGETSRNVKLILQMINAEDFKKKPSVNYKTEQKNCP